jgi:DNA-binding CsgD family transcriptional regulator
MDDQEAEAQDRLLHKLYDAVLAPDGFQSFLPLLAGEFRLKGVALVVRNIQGKDASGLWLHGIEHRWMESYALTYGREDTLAAHLERVPIGRFYASNLDLPQADGGQATRFFREWAAPQGVTYAAAGVVLREGTWQTQVFLQRSTDQGAFTRAEMQRLDLLVPHWQRAVQMRQRLVSLRGGQDLLSASLDAIAMPALLFDETGSIVHGNRSAIALLRSRGPLWRSGGRLMATSPEASRKLHLQISDAVRTQREGRACAASVVVVDRPARLPLTATVLPLRGLGDQPVRSGALMFIFDPEQAHDITADLVRKLFKLSPAEAQLAVSLCAGRTLEEIAAERGRALSTVRSQVRSLFDKTGTNRQTDLVSLLLASPACFLAKEHREPIR